MMYNDEHSVLLITSRSTIYQFLLELQIDKIIDILLQKFERFSSIFIAQKLLSNLPSLNPATFKKNFLAYMETEEYYEYIRVIRERAYQYEQKPR